MRSDSGRPRRHSRPQSNRRRGGGSALTMSRPAIIPSGSWPLRMTAELAAAYRREPIVEASSPIDKTPGKRNEDGPR